MNIDKDMKKQIIILSSIAVIMIIIAIILNTRQNNDSNRLNENNLQNNITNENKVIEGMNEKQVDNLKGLMENDKYEEYKDYFNSNNNNVNEVIRNSTTAQDLASQGESVDYITDSEQKDLDQELEEALKMYGYDNTEE